METPNASSATSGRSKITKRDEKLISQDLRVYRLLTGDKNLIITSKWKLLWYIILYVNKDKDNVRIYTTSNVTKRELRRDRDSYRTNRDGGPGDEAEVSIDRQPQEKE